MQRVTLSDMTSLTAADGSRSREPAGRLPTTRPATHWSLAGPTPVTGR